MGMLKQEAGDSLGARVAYEKALELDANTGIAANNLAWLLAESGQVDGALRWAQKAHSVLSDSPAVQDTVGWMYHLGGRQDAAIRWLRSARDKAPRNATYRYHLGAAYASAGRIKEARAELAEALRLPGSFPEARAARQQLEAIEPTDGDHR
jgi:Flp pilus assembly protein TadD